MEPMTMLAIGTTVAGGVMQASSSIKGGKANQQLANYNARIDERNARAAKQNARVRRWIADRTEVRLYEDGMGFIKDQQARYGFAGVGMGTGTPAIVAMAMADRIEDQVVALQYEASTEAINMEEQMRQFEMSAAMKRAGGKAARQAGKIQAVSSLLATAGNIGMKYR